MACESLRGLGKWITHKRRLCEQRQKDAAYRLERALVKSGISEEGLRLEWETQVEAQTRKLPCK